jgi:hypothetical protein
MKAKDIAISMSGQAGKFVSDMGNKIAGTTIGLATGGAAMAMRGTVGAMGARMARSETLTNMENKGGFQGFLGRNLRNAGLKVGEKSFDFRNTSIWKTTIDKGLGLGESTKKPFESQSKPGVGFLGNQEEKVKKVEKRQADLDKLKPKTENEKKREVLDKQQAELEVKISPVLEQAEKERDEAKENYVDEKEKRDEAYKKLTDAEKELKQAKGVESKKAAGQKLKEAQTIKAEADKKLAEADKKLEKAKNNVSDIKNGANAVKNELTGKIEIKFEEGKYNTNNKNVSKKLVENIEKRHSIKETKQKTTNTTHSIITKAFDDATKRLETEKQKGNDTQKLEKEVERLRVMEEKALEDKKEADEEFKEIEDILKTVKKHEKVAEDKGGTGKSLSETRKDSASLSAEIKQEQNQEKLARAKNWEGGTNNLFDYLSHGRVGGEQAQDQANKLYQSINKK